MRMNHTSRDCNATAVYHALSERCYHTDSDLGRGELFASFRLFMIPISALFTKLEDPAGRFGKVQICGREDGRGKVDVQSSPMGLNIGSELECFPNGTRRQPDCETRGIGCTSRVPPCLLQK